MHDPRPRVGLPTRGALHHYRTLQALPLVLGPARKDDAVYLETCRIKRNTVEYDMAGAATHADASSLLEFASELRRDVISWLEANHPRLL